MWITFSVSVQESAASTSASTLLSRNWADLLEQSAWWRGKHSQSRWWQKRFKKAPWLQALCGSEIWDRYPLENFLASTGTSVAIPASPFPPLANNKGSLILDTFGQSSEDKSLLLGQEDCFSRTSVTIGKSAQTASSETWRRWGIALLAASTRREKSAHLTGGGDSSCSPSQTARSDSSSTNETCSTTSRSGGGWPTPTAGDSRNSARHTTKTGAMHAGTTLVDAVRMWPTPTAREWKDSPGMSPHRNGKKNGRLDSVSRMVFSEAGLHDQETSSERGSRPVSLNPDWVDCLMGFPIGWTDLEHWGTPSSPSKQNMRSSDSGGC